MIEINLSIVRWNIKGIMFILGKVLYGNLFKVRAIYEIK